LKQLPVLRSLRPNTVNTFFRCARGALDHVGEASAEITTDDVERYLLELSRRIGTSGDIFASPAIGACG